MILYLEKAFGIIVLWHGIFRIWKVKNNRRAAEGWDYDAQAKLKPDAKAVPLMNKILLQFIEKAKEKNIIPMIYLVSNVPENAVYLAIDPEVKKNAFIETQKIIVRIKIVHTLKEMGILQMNVIKK